MPAVRVDFLRDRRDGGISSCLGSPRNLAVLVIGCCSVLLAQTAQAPLTNERITDLSRNGVQQDELSRIIATAPQIRFDLSPAAENEMLKAGVSEGIIRAMAARETGGVQTGNLASVTNSVASPTPQKYNHSIGGDAMVTVFTNKDMGMEPHRFNIWAKFRIFVDSQQVGGKLDGNRFFTVALPHGVHSFAVGTTAPQPLGHLTRNDHLSLTLKPGEHVYVFESFEMGIYRNRVALRVVSCNEMRGYDFSRLKPSKDIEGVVEESSFPVCSTE